MNERIERREIHRGSADRVHIDRHTERDKEKVQSRDDMHERR